MYHRMQSGRNFYDKIIIDSISNYSEKWLSDNIKNQFYYSRGTKHRGSSNFGV